MSLGVAIKGPEGIVLAADSRVTLQAQPRSGNPILVNFDNATKLLGFSGEAHQFVGAVTYGVAVIDLRTAHSFMPEFELTLPDQRLTVLEYARRLGEFFAARWRDANLGSGPGNAMTFIVAGYDPDAAYGSVYVVAVPDGLEPVPRNEGNSFGMTWGGQLEVASRLVHGFDPALPGILQRELNLPGDQVDRVFGAMRPELEFRIPYQVLPLQDCVDLATFLLRTTMTAQNLSVGVRGVGGTVDVAVVTRTKGLDFVQQKVLHGETGSARPGR